MGVNGKAPGAVHVAGLCCAEPHAIDLQGPHMMHAHETAGNTPRCDRGWLRALGLLARKSLASASQAGGGYSGYKRRSKAKEVRWRNPQATRREPRGEPDARARMQGPK